MTDRFDITPLVRAALGGMTHRAVLGKERRDWVALATLTLLPVASAVVSMFFGWRLRDAGSLVAGLSLLGAALLALVVQFAAWRGRLSERKKPSEAVARRAIDEAVANTLLATLTCVALAALTAVLSNISAPDPTWTVIPAAAEVLTALIIGGCVYLGLILLVVLNLLFDAYQQATSDDASNSDKRNKNAA